MKRKNISKFALLVSLLTINTTANSFYQCIPKKSWKRIAHLTPQSKQEEFKQTLQAGKYRVTAAGGGGRPEIKEFTLTSSQEFKACAGERAQDPVGDIAGKGGSGMGYQGRYDYKIESDTRSNKEYKASGYGKGERGQDCKEVVEFFQYLPATGGEGCFIGGNGKSTPTIENEHLYYLLGHGGGSYFSVNNLEMILKGNAISRNDGYVIIEKFE